jgi:hypothetical protein
LIVAEIVFGGATSHGTTTVLPWEEWLERAEGDALVPLYKDGRERNFDELTAEMGDSIAHELLPEVLEARADHIRRSLDRLQTDIKDARLDVLVVIGDDQGEMFDSFTTPTISIHRGDEGTTLEMPLPQPAPAWMRHTVEGLGIDARRVLATAGDLATELIQSLVAEGFDIAPCRSGMDGSGLGHAFTFPQVRLLDGAPVRLLPILLNTYYPPNQPSPARCFELGLALRRALEGSTGRERIGVLASGGLSHFIVEERLDATVLNAIKSNDRLTLERLPLSWLREGSSEIRNWIAAAGVFAGHGVTWCEYIPTRRSHAGSGCGNGFLVWDVTDSDSRYVLGDLR